MNAPLSSDIRRVWNLSAVLGVLEAEDNARQERRREWLAHLAQARESLNKLRTGFASRIRPIEQKISEHRAALDLLQAELDPLLREQDSAEFVAASSERQLKAALRKDVERCLHDFQYAVDELRAEVSGNLTGRRSIVLGNFDQERPLQERIGGAMKRLLTAYHEAEQIAVTETDVTGALARLRAELVTEGIGFLGEP